MPEENLRFILSNSLPVAIVRLDGLDLSLYRRDLCRAFSVAFGLSEEQGDEIFSNGVEKGQLETITGFDINSNYANFENIVRTIINDATPNLSQLQLNILTLSIHSIIFSYSISPNISFEILYDVIGKLIKQLAIYITNLQPYDVDEKGKLLHPFTLNVIENITSQNNYSLTIQDISNSPRNFEIDLVHYNWYDTTRLFSGPNLDLMKDAENQYYYISGQLLYPQIPSDLIECQESFITIDTVTGTINTSYISNSPCVNKNGFVGPVSGIKFFRAFNDGPYSSGDFNTGVKNQFISFDTEVLSGDQYKSNGYKLYSFLKNGGTGDYIPIYNKFILNDTNGEYNIEEEYKYAPTSTGCFPKYQIMRVGDARTRLLCLKYDESNTCENCQELPSTGFKYALIELDPTKWSGDFVDVRNNPYTKVERIVKRALNINSNNYISTEKNGELNTFTYDVANNEQWYLGPPQILGTDTLPFFAFIESFENVTFGNAASITLYPALGTSTPSLSGNSTRKYEISSIPLISGSDESIHGVLAGLESFSFPRAKFNNAISAYNLNDDDIKLKFFGMGNALSGKFNIITSMEENAGYIYSGYVLKDSGNNLVSFNNSLLDLFKDFKIGSEIKEVKYISGYSGVQNNIEISKLYAHDGSGNNLQYYFFDNRLSPIEVTNQNEWTTFSPLPSGLENNANYSRVYGKQKNENYFPRYYKGPYATVNKKFLYPNAKSADNLYKSKVNGFPNKFKYKITVREEAIKEVYAKYPVENGIIFSPELINVIRSDNNLGVFQDPSIGVNETLFLTSNSEYDFNSRGVSGFLYYTPLSRVIDNNYTPVSNVEVDSSSFETVPSGKNSIIYDQQPIFKQGILLTGDSLNLQNHIVLTGIGNGYLYFSNHTSAVGLYNTYTGFSITGEILYTKPAFCLENNTLEKAFAIKAVPILEKGCVSWLFCDGFGNCNESIADGLNDLYTRSLNGRIFNSSSGQDPIFYEYIGGRRGGELANMEGGYHSQNIIGDSWIGLSYKDFGYYCSVNGDTCFINGGVTGHSLDAYQISNRVPSEDKEWIFLNVNPDFTNIYTRGLNYNPMSYKYQVNPFLENSKLYINNELTEVLYKDNINCLYFDLNNYFPLKEVTGNGQWYFYPSGSGVIIGPFDRDVELFADKFNPITGYSQIHVNLWRVSDYFGGSMTDNCSPPRYLSGDFSPKTYGISLDYHNIKPFFYIPSGGKAIINVRSYTGSENQTGDQSKYIGFPGNSFLNIRARNVLNEFELSDTEKAKLQIYGSTFWLNNKNMINNTSERMFSIENPDKKFENLEGKTFTFTTFARSGKFYNLDYIENEISNYTGFDEFGNILYGFDDIEDLFKKTSIKYGNTLYVSGWREGSRISFTFEDISIDYDSLPYETHNIIIPSGDCIVSGEMGYLSQADNTVFSEGFYIKDMTQNDTIKDKLYGPSFVSEVIKRVPFFDYPSGDFIHPTLTAPSAMKQRKNRSLLDIDQTYSGLNSFSPYNFNKLLWPALSDLKVLNPEETLESLPPDDGNTYLNDQILISASQGQKLPNGKNNPNFKKLYVIQNQYQMYDSIATDAIINSKYFITSKFGFETKLDQPESGILTTKDTPLSNIKAGLF